MNGDYTCINSTHTHTHIYIYIYVCVCVRINSLTREYNMGIVIKDMYNTFRLFNPLMTGNTI